MAYDTNKLSKLAALEALAQRVKAEHATKAELQAVSERLDGVVSQGGEPNVLEGVKVNGIVQTIADKMVDILIATGTANGTISAAGVDVAIKGLAALAYKAAIEPADLSAAVKEIIEAKATQADVDALTDTINTLIGEDTGKSARTIANEELAKQLIPENAAEALDTLTEIAAWIQAHPGDAAAMNKAITDLTALVGTLPEGTTSTTVVSYIAEAISSALTGYYTRSEIDAMIATDAEVSEMLDSVFGAA